MRRCLFRKGPVVSARVYAELPEAERRTALLRGAARRAPDVLERVSGLGSCRAWADRAVCRWRRGECGPNFARPSRPPRPLQSNSSQRAIATQFLQTQMGSGSRRRNRVAWRSCRNRDSTSRCACVRWETARLSPACGSGKGTVESERVKVKESERVLSQAELGLLTSTQAKVAAAGLEWLYEDPRHSKDAQEREQASARRAAREL